MNKVRHWKIKALVIVAAALVLRITYVAETGLVTTLRHLIGDAAGYTAWAHRIAEGRVGPEASFYQAPLYPYVLALLIKVWGDGVIAIRLLQACFGALGCWFLACAGRRVSGDIAGLVCAGMWALYAPALFFDGIVQKASLAGMLVCALLCVVAWCHNRSTIGRAIVLGLVSGVLVLTRENALVWIPLLAAWLWMQGVKPRRVVLVAGFGLGLLIPLGPAAVHNRVTSGEWSLTTFQSGPNFYIGNHRGASGRYEPLVPGHETPTFERADATRLAVQARGRNLSPREVSSYWHSRAWADIGDDPAGWLRLLGRKWMMVWNAYEIADAEGLCVYADHSSLLRGLSAVWHFGVLAPLAAMGFVLTRKQGRTLWIHYAMTISMALAVTFFYVMARYRFPLVPILVLLAAGGMVEMAGRWKDRSWRSLALCGVVGLVTAGLVNYPFQDERRLDGLLWMNAGVAMAEGGDVSGAIPYFRRAIAAHPSSAEGHLNLAQALALQGDYANAIGHYRAALSLEESLPGAHYNLAVALERVGRTEEALTHYRKALAIDGADVEARRALRRLGANRK